VQKVEAEADDIKVIAKVIKEDMPEEAAPKAQILEEEVIEVGSVSWETYKRLYRMGPLGLWSIGFVVLLHIIINACNLAVSLYLALTLTERFVAADEDPAQDRQYNYYLSLIIIGALVSTFIGKYASNYVFMRINRRVHSEMVKSVLHAHIRFFEENTQGRIINRFSKDIATLDQMVFQVLEMIDRMVSCFFSLVLVVMIVPWLLILVAISFYYLVNLRKKTIYVNRDTMRLKSVLASPINSLIKDAINGLPTLRCLGKQEFFM
jgi:ABC-type multidrug transport system fused ATPase/permease subunit